MNITKHVQILLALFLTYSGSSYGLTPAPSQQQRTYIAVGDYGDAGNNPDKHSHPIIAISQDEGTSWTNAHIDNNVQLPSGYYMSSVLSVSCTRHACLAVAKLDSDNGSIPPNNNKNDRLHGITLLLRSEDHGLNWSPLIKYFDLNDTVMYATCGPDHCLASVTHTDPNTGDYTPSLMMSDATVTQWTTNANIIGFPATARHAAIHSVSCTAGSCVGVGEDDKSKENLFIVSHDEGKSWQYVTNVFTTTPLPVPIDDVDSSHVACEGAICFTNISYVNNSQDVDVDTLMVSQDHGDSWSEINASYKQLGNVNIEKVACTNEACLLIGTSDSTLPTILRFDLRTQMMSHVDKILNIPKDIDYANLGAIDCNSSFCAASGEYRLANDDAKSLLLTSHDGGLSWTMIDKITDFPILENQSIEFVAMHCNNQTCMMGGEYNGMIDAHTQHVPLVVSHDNGLTWSFVPKIANMPTNILAPEIVDITSIS